MGLLELLERISGFLSRILMWIGGIFLLSMVVLTCANIFLRLVWIPVSGAFELMGYFGAVVAAFALGQTQMRRGHIAVDVLINTFSARTRRALQVVNSSACLVFFGLVAWQTCVKARTIWLSGEVTETLRIIYYPFTYAVALGFAVLALVLVTDFLKTMFGESEAAK